MSVRYTLQSNGGYDMMIETEKAIGKVSELL